MNDCGIQLLLAVIKVYYPPLGPMDFMEVSPSFLFTVNTTNQMECVTVNIKDDDDIEGAETLTVSIPLMPDIDEAVITILDLDGERSPSCMHVYALTSKYPPHSGSCA
jgi:hypothetical protein